MADKDDALAKFGRGAQSLRGLLHPGEFCKLFKNDNAREVNRICPEGATDNLAPSLTNFASSSSLPAILKPAWRSALLAFAFVASTLSAQPLPQQLSTLSRNFLEVRSRDSELKLREFASKGNGEQGAMAYFVLGYADWQDRHFDNAAAYLRLARANRSPLSDFVDFYLASSLQNSGNHAESIPLLDGFEKNHPDSTLISRAAFALATALNATGASAKAIAVLKANWSAYPHPAADLLLADAYAGDGQKDAAMAAYRDVYYRYPTSEEAAEAAKHKANFPKATTELWRARGDGLLAGAHSKATATRLYLEAQAAYKAAAAASPKGPERDHAEIAAVAVLFRMGKNPQARSALAAIQPTSPEGKAERLYRLAECDRRLKNTDAMEEDINALEKEHSDSSWFQEALYSIGNYELVHSRLQNAASFYESLVKHFPDGKYAMQSYWKVAWARYRNGDYAAARTYMDQELAKYPSGVYTPDAIYWSGRIDEASDKAAAQTLFRRVAEGYPNNFYGILAKQRLASAFNTAVTQVGIAFTPPVIPPEAKSRRTQIDAMRSLGLLDLAGTELRQLAQNKDGQAYWYMELAAIERERGRYFTSIEYARKSLSNFSQLNADTIPKGIWDLLYPLPWWQEVREECNVVGLDPYLVAGLMRQESLFQEHAVSPAKAYGLMQILPSTGRSLARKLGIRGFTTTSLFNPRINIKMGVHYFKSILDANDGRVEDALAAYNAGQSRVDTWRHENYKDAPEFVESIPFSETRDYVQIVMRNAEIYRRLYNH